MEKDTSNHYLNDLIEFEQELKKNRYYTLQRLDVLIILLSTSGIFFLTTNSASSQSPYLLVISIIAFVCAIILNLISQQLAYLTNNKYIEVIKAKIRDLRYNGIVIETDYHLDSKIAKRLNNITEILNHLSLIILITGIITSLIILLKGF
jgi:predicted membrane channel-forming protein YqfA (hemolysin III family)